MFRIDLARRPNQRRLLKRRRHTSNPGIDERLGALIVAIGFREVPSSDMQLGQCLQASRHRPKIAALLRVGSRKASMFLSLVKIPARALHLGHQRLRICKNPWQPSRLRDVRRDLR